MLTSLLSPRSVAVVGVSLDPDKVGHQVFVNLLSFKGDLFAVNPKHTKILGKPCFPSVSALPSNVDLVVIVTPHFTVEGIIDECITKDVKAVIIITAGFAENGKSGREIQDRIATKLKEHNILLLGPNTLGAIHPKAKLNASFAPALIADGHIALISQSGAMLTTIFAEFESRGVGCSFALSLGNKAGISEIEALEYALHDPSTHCIALYLESLLDARSFMTACKKVSKTKPIIFLKGGTTDAGQQASLSHTAALATNSVLLKEASYQMGYVLVETIEQFFETTFFVDKLMTSKKEFPENIMILTNAGGPGVNAIDLASKWGLIDATWSKESIATFAREMPRVTPHNPTDLIGDANVEETRLGLEIAMEDDNIQSVLLIITPQAVTDIPGITQMLIKLKKTKPLVVALMGGEKEHPYVVKLREADISAVEYANEGIEMFAWVNQIRHAQFIDRSDALMKQLESVLVGSEPAKIVERRRFSLHEGSLEETYIMLENYGFSLPRCAIATSPADVDAMKELDPERVFPLIAKTANLHLKHKAVVGGVIKDVNTVEEAHKAYTHLKKFGERVLFQEVITDAAEIIVGGKRDSAFGTFVAVGMGGSLTNILADRSYIFLPASQREIRAALHRTKMFESLNNDQRSLCLLALERFARIFNEHPEIAELEINPLMITKDTAYVADVKVTLASL